MHHFLPRAMFLVGVLAGFAHSAMAQEAVELTLKCRQGDTFRMAMVSQQKIHLPDRNITMNQRFGTTIQFDVTGVESDGTQTLNVSYTAVTFRQDGPTGRVDFDSAKPPEQVPEAAQPFAALVGEGFTVSLSSRGQVRNLDGLDRVVTKMLATIDLPPGPGRKAMEQGIKDQFGKEAMAQNLQNLMSVYPDNPVKAGDRWKTVAAMTQGLPVTSETTYTLKKITADTVTLESESRITPTADAGPMDMGPVKLRYDLSGTQKGTLELDRATGWTRSSDLTQSFSGKMIVSLNETTVDQPMSIEGMVTLRLE